MANSTKREISPRAAQLLKDSRVRISRKQLLDKIKNSTVNTEMRDGKPTTMTVENLQKFVAGDITWAKLQGLSMQQVYSIADFGYNLFEQGKYEDARKIFQGLVMMNPFDGYFHCVLGSIYARENKDEEAILEYTFAVNSEPPMVEAFVNRAEVLLRNGQLEYAMADLKKATELDPDNENPATLRARALARATAAVLSEMLPKKSAR